MNPQNKTIALFAVVGYVVSVFLSVALWGTSAGALLLLLALVPCAVALGWVKILFLHPRLQTVPALLRGGGVGLLSYLSFGVLMAVWLSLRSYGLRENLWYFLVAGTAMFGLPLMAVGAATDSSQRSSSARSGHLLLLDVALPERYSCAERAGRHPSAGRTEST